MENQMVIQNENPFAVSRPKNINEGTVTIEKTRYAFPYKDHIVEIDVFPFMKSTAFLEVELSGEDEQFELPEFVNVIKDVTHDPRYTNAALAKVDRDPLDFE